MNKCIRLNNRGNHNYRLVQSDTDPMVYWFEGDALYFNCIGDLEDIQAIDPEDGPMLGVGSTVGGMVIGKVFFDSGLKRYCFRMTN